MLGVMMLLSFILPLAGVLMIRRYAWIAAWAAMAAVTAFRRTDGFEHLAGRVFQHHSLRFALLAASDF